MPPDCSVKRFALFEYSPSMGVCFKQTLHIRDVVAFDRAMGGIFYAATYAVSHKIADSTLLRHVLELAFEPPDFRCVAIERWSG